MVLLFTLSLLLHQQEEGMVIRLSTIWKMPQGNYFNILRGNSTGGLRR